MITPAISVLSAVEGLTVTSSALQWFIIPLTIGILLVLFFVQRSGTARVGAVFGPVIALWFIALAVLGVTQIMAQPDILGAVHPGHAIAFFINNGFAGYWVLGAVFLVVTGGEALYADMGHFGRRPIQITWFAIVLPALLLNYFGQGALLLGHPEAASNPFFLMAPTWARYPLIVLATCATVIASQAVISGVFSLTMQAVQLGYLPRMKIEHTSARQIGQIYVPTINWILMAGTIGLVLVFARSENLAAAYGMAIAATMVITTILLLRVAHELWKWPWWIVAAMAIVFVSIDLAFFGTNLRKIAQGGWFPLAIGVGILLIMTTWKAGRGILWARMRDAALPLDHFIANLESQPPARVAGTAVFLTANSGTVPLALLHNLKHNKVLHERAVLLTVAVEEVPHIRPEDRLQIDSLGLGFHRLIARYGFMDEPHIPRLLDQCASEGLKFNLSETTFFLGVETLLPSKRPKIARWRESLFMLLSRNAHRATTYFHLPHNRVVEMGTQLEL